MGHSWDLSTSGGKHPMEWFLTGPMSGSQRVFTLPKFGQAMAPYCTPTTRLEFQPESRSMARTSGSQSTTPKTFPRCSWASKFESSQKSEVINLEELYETFADWNHCSLTVLADNSSDGTG